MNGIEFKSRLARLLFLRSGIPTCYVGVNSDDKPLVMLWLITPDFNKKIQHYFKGGIQPLRPDEVLCEFVYVHPNYRGYRLHTWCQLSLFSKAQAQGARKAFAYVSIDNATSVHATRRFGWEPCVTKVVERRLFTKKIAFSLCASHMPRQTLGNLQKQFDTWLNKIVEGPK
jgi:GNAT superfamily N-acetyltransferase